MPTNRQQILDNRPEGEAVAGNFKLVDRRDAGAEGQPGAGAPPLHEPRPLHARAHERRQELCRSRSRWAQVMQGGTVGEVVESKHPEVRRRRQGGRLRRLAGVQRGRCRAARRAEARSTPTHVPLSHYLGAVGMPGVTAWYGLVKIIAAEGRRDGGRHAPPAARSAAPSARWPRRAAAAWWASPAAPTSASYVTDELGFDACIDYQPASGRQEH